MTEQRRTKLQAGGAILVIVAILTWVTSAVLGATGSDHTSRDLSGAGSIAMTIGAGAPGSTTDEPGGAADANGAQGAQGATKGGAGSHDATGVDVPIGDGSWQDGGDDFDWVHVPVGSGAHRDFGVGVSPVSGLYPGSFVRLPITLSNPKNIAISVDAVVISATGTTSCPATSLRIGNRAFTTPVVIAPHSSRGIKVRFGMRKIAPDGCQGAALDVTVTASAVAA